MSCERLGRVKSVIQRDIILDGIDLSEINKRERICAGVIVGCFLMGLVEAAADPQLHLLINPSIALSWTALFNYINLRTKEDELKESAE